MTNSSWGGHRREVVFGQNFMVTGSFTWKYKEDCFGEKNGRGGGLSTGGPLSGVLLYWQWQFCLQVHLFLWFCRMCSMFRSWMAASPGTWKSSCLTLVGELANICVWHLFTWDLLLIWFSWFIDRFISWFLLTHWLRVWFYAFALIWFCHSLEAQYALSIGWFSEAGLLKWMPFVIFRARSRKRSQRHFRANFWVGVASRCV